MPYVCEEHKIAFEKESQAKAHWNFQHGKGAWANADQDVIVQDEVPEGITLREVPGEKAPARTAERTERVIEAPPSPKIAVKDDPEAERLDHMLRAIGVPDSEADRIVNGFVNIPRIRDDANYLSHWLDTHIRADKALKAYIPMIVQEVMGQDGKTVLPMGGFDGGGSRYPQFPGYYPPNNYYREQPFPLYYQPESKKDKDSETMLHIEALNKRFDSMLGMIQADREEREHEQKEREQKEREQQINAKIDKVQETVLEFIKSQGSSTKSEAESKANTQIEALVAEIKEMRTDQQKAAYDALLTELTNLRQAVGGAKGETTGRSTEDLVHDLGPLALDKFDKIGQRVENELKGLREQIGPGVKEKIDEAVKEPKSIEIIEDQVNTENEIVELINAGNIEVRAEGEEPPTETPEAQPEEPYRRMPNPTRRRRAAKGGESSDQVPGATAVTDTP